MNKKLELTLKHFARQKKREIVEILIGLFVLIVFSWVALQYLWLPVYIYEWLGNPFLDKPFDEIMKMSKDYSDPTYIWFLFYWSVFLLIQSVFIMWIVSNWEKASELATKELKPKTKRRKRK